MIVRLLLLILLLSAIFGGIFFWKAEQQRQAAAMQMAPPPAAVAATEVRAVEWQPRLRAVGSLVAEQGIQITTEVEGLVREIHFDSGQRVEAGQLLLRLDDSVEQAELQGLLAEQRLAAIKHRRLAELLKDRSVSPSDVDEAKAQLDNASAQVAGKRAALAKKRIVAPFSGYLGIRAVDQGQFVEPGTALVSLQTLDRLYLDFSLPERHLREVSVDQKVEIVSAAFPDNPFSGRIAAINPAVDQASRSLMLRAVLDNPEHLLRPGSFVEVAVLLPNRDSVLVVPRVAVTFAPYGDAVFVIEEQAGSLLVRQQQVTTGAVLGDDIEIVAGLELGQRLVLAGQVKLRNDQQVQIDNEVLPVGGTPGK
jgi:membrane fusion protein (multidrug efflux system)